MSGIPSADLERVRRFLALCDARNTGRPDETVASDYGLSPAALYRQLATDGYPVCPECGALHPDQRHRQAHVRQNVRQKRKARAEGGEAVEIPVANAVPLFEGALERLRGGLGGLDRLRLSLEDVGPRGNGNGNKRFVARHRLYGAKDKTALPDGLEGESVLEHRREQIEPQDPEYWRALCEEHGLDPEKANSVMVPVDHDRRDGASPAPPEYLVAQVANHVLTGGDVEELLEALHPRPEEVDRAALYGDEPKRPGPVAGLRTYARRLSTIVCGGKVRSGPPTPAISKGEHRAAAYVRERRGGGATDKQIAAELRDGAVRPLTIPITPEEVRRLGGLGLAE
jgi:hypothetical protein